MQSVKQALADIIEAEKILKTRPEDTPYATRPGFEVRQQQARDSIQDLRQNIENITVPKRLAGIFATGDSEAIKKTAEFLTANGGIVVNAAGIYQAVADDIEKNIGAERIFQTTQFATLISHIRDIGNNYNLSEISSPNYQEKLLPDYKSIVTHARDLVRSSSGDTLNVLVLRRQLVDAVIDRGLSGKTIPVLVTNTIPAERTALAPLFSKSGVVEFSEGFEPSNQEITKAFRKAKQ